MNTRQVKQIQIAIGIIISIVALVVVIGTAMIKTKQPKENPETLVPSYTLTASQLYAAYDANEVAADNKYKGKVIVVSGTIESIGKDILDEAYIVLEAGGMMSGVQCMFSDEYLLAFNKISKGQNVSILGTVSGLSLGSVLVELFTPIIRMGSGEPFYHSLPKFKLTYYLFGDL